MKTGYGGHWAILLCCLLCAGCKDKVTNTNPYPITPPVGAAFSSISEQVTFFDLRTNEITAQLDLGGNISSAEFALTGTALYLADNYSGFIAIHTLPNMERVDLLETGGVPLDLCLNTPATQIFLINNNGNFRRFGRDDTDVDTLGVGLSPRRLALKPPEEMQVWIACRGDFSVYVVDLVGFTASDTLQFAGPPSDICFSPDGSEVYIAVQCNHGVWKLDASTFETTGILLAGPGPMDLAMNHDGTILAVSDSTLGTVRVWELSNGSPQRYHDVQVGDGAGRIRFTRGDTFYVMSRAENHVVCVDVSGTEPEITATIDIPPQISEISLWE